MSGERSRFRDQPWPRSLTATPGQYCPSIAFDLVTRCDLPHEYSKEWSEGFSPWGHRLVIRTERVPGSILIHPGAQRCTTPFSLAWILDWGSSPLHEYNRPPPHPLHPLPYPLPKKKKKAIRIIVLPAVLTKDMATETKTRGMAQRNRRHRQSTRWGKETKRQRQGHRQSIQ